MVKEDVLKKLIAQEPALAFVDLFLQTHSDAQLYLVGGAVRDRLLRRKMAEMDFDFVIRGLSAEDVQTWFSTQGEVNLVGQHFGVFKFMPRGFSSDRIPFIDLALHVQKPSQKDPWAATKILTCNQILPSRSKTTWHGATSR